jgi:UDP-glucose 4-epimerase
MSFWSHFGPRARHGPHNLAVRILITGGLGFVGGRLAKHLHSSGNQIVLGSRSLEQPPSWLSQAEMTMMEWYDEEALERCCNNIDAIIHAAGMNSQDCVADPEGAIQFNGFATKRLVEAAIKAKVSKFIYLSTAHVYANPLAGRITESTLPNNPHPYASSNLSGETAVLNFSERGLIQGIVLRLSNVFGAPMSADTHCWTLLVNDLCRQVARRKRLVLKTSGLQYRDFVSMTDVCHVADVMLSQHSPSIKTAIFNVGSGHSHSVLEMAQLIQQRSKPIFGYQPDLHYEKSATPERAESLYYSNERLASIGVAIGKNKNSLFELDTLLQYCKQTFVRGSSNIPSPKAILT